MFKRIIPFHVVVPRQIDRSKAILGVNCFCQKGGRDGGERMVTNSVKLFLMAISTPTHIAGTLHL